MRQFAWFDCLRCAAVFLVIVAHSGHLNEALPAVLARPFIDFQLISWVGVDLFFVLSGFLVSGLLFGEHDKTGTLHIQRFLIRRGFKIIPPFYFLVLVTLAYDWFVRGKFNRDHLFHDIFFLQSYRIGSWGHAWTLAVEVHFYLLLALLLWYLAQRRVSGGKWLTPLPTILCWVFVASFLVRLINSSLQHTTFNVHRELQPSHLHLDVLGAGVFLRYLYNYHSASLAIFRRGKIWWIALGVLLVLPSEYTWNPPAHICTALVPTGNALGFSLILFEATQVSFPAVGFWHWVLKPFDFIGKHSYSIYLWHNPVREWLVEPLVKTQGALYFFSFLIGSVVVGTFFSLVLEMPVLALRNRLFPSFTPRRVNVPTPPELAA